MDKKKVKELIDKTLLLVKTTDGFYEEDDENLNDIELNLEDIKAELSKSDWVSVEDGLPPYGERVDVCDKANPTEVYQTRRKKAPAGLTIDKNRFICILPLRITHWKPIEKLEV